MDEAQAVFEQLTSSNFKMWKSTVLIIFNNYSIIMTNNSDNLAITWLGAVVSVANLWVSLTCYSGELHIVSEYVEDLSNI